MYTEVDNRRGFVRTDWLSIRDRVKNVEPEFAKLVDEIDPKKQTHPLYLAYFPFGEVKGDTEDNFLPLVDGGVERLSSANLPDLIKKELGYGIASSPMGLVLEKSFEFYVDIKVRKINQKDNFDLSYPYMLGRPGCIFPLARLMKSHRTFFPNGLLSVTAGARSTFVLTSIASYADHCNLEAKLNRRIPAPTSYSNHWELFKILTSEAQTTDWRACLIYFSEKWVTDLYHNPAWSKLKDYLYRVMWHRTEFQRASELYAIAYSSIQNSEAIKRNPYLVDTSRHLFNIALGEYSGFVPATTEEEIPLIAIRDGFKDYYRAKDNELTIMVPGNFDFQKKEPDPVYYSLQHPTVTSYTVCNRKHSTTAKELRDLADVLRHFREQLTNNPFFAGTDYQRMASSVSFDYFHNIVDYEREDSVIMSSGKLVHEDERFSQELSAKAKFMRGVVRLTKDLTRKELNTDEEIVFAV